MLAWTPYEYYTSSPYEVFAACEGYFDKMDIDARNLRFASFRIHQSLSVKPLSLEEYWPLKGDKPQSTEKITMTREMYAEIKKAHNL